MLGPMSATVTVREIVGAGELRACQDLQRKAWGITEDGYVVPVATMVGAQKVGGLVLGAFSQQGELIGFAFAFLGRLRGQWILYSQLTGVHPAHQSSGVGRLLKFEQQRRAAAAGLAAIVWAFDPLQASNAAFNLAVLGVTCRDYEIDLYGSRTDALNAGLATDRLFAEWSTEQRGGGRTQPWADGVDLIVTEPSPAGRYRSVQGVQSVPSSVDHVQVEIPARLADVKTYGGQAAAQRWQFAVRGCLREAFAAGFVAVGFSRLTSDQPRYLLERHA
jgi:predicted GNAT superfamily acetyltransferase